MKEVGQRRKREREKDRQRRGGGGGEVPPGTRAEFELEIGNRMSAQDR